MNIKEIKNFFEKNKNNLTVQEMEQISTILTKLETTSSNNNSINISDEFKEKGNEAFKNGDLQLALEMFTKSIETDPFNYLAYSNRSLVFHKLNEIENVIKDCLAGLELEPKFVKFYIRLAMVYSETDRNKAYGYCKEGLKYEPGNKNLKELAELNRPSDEEENEEENNEENDIALDNNMSAGSPFGFDSSQINDLLKNKNLKDMYESLIKDKSPEELSKMMNDVLGQFKK